MIALNPPSKHGERLIAIIACSALAAAMLVWRLTSDHGAFFRAYLFAYLVCLGIALGSLCLAMLHNLTGGDWGISIRPITRAASLTLPLLALLYFPLLGGLPDLYPWAQSATANDLIIHRHSYLNVPFFIIRAAAYFVIWITLAFVLDRWTRQYHAAPSLTLASRLRGLSAAGLILYLWTMTHAGIDWIMSRNTEFYSTAFGFILTTGQTLSAMAFALILLPWLSPAPSDRRTRGIFNDIGNVLLTLVILWMYVSFMEFLVVWMSNSHEDNSWFLKRGLSGDAQSFPWIAAILFLCHFFIPFYLLLFRSAKQNRPALTGIAWLLFLAHILEEYWLAKPPGLDSDAQFAPHLLDPLLLLALLGLWLATFSWILRRQRPSPGDSPFFPLKGSVIHE